MKHGKVRPCEDGIQKTAHLLKRECCRPEKEPWRTRRLEPNLIAMANGETIHTVKADDRMNPDRGANHAFGVAWNYFPL